MTTAAHGGVTLAALWRLLSLGFTSPREETVAEVEVLAEALVEAEASADVRDVLGAVRSASAEELSSQYAALFRGKVLVPPYEGSYEVDPIRQGRQMADAAAFYRAFGAEAHGPIAERPDFAGCELEFLSFLELRRVAAHEAGDEGADLVEEIGNTFLADHAGRWLPTFFAEVETEAVGSPFYKALAELGTRVLDEELTRRDIDPAPLPRRRARTTVERDSFDCGAETPAPPRTF